MKASELKDKFKLLNLSNKEAKVFVVLRDGEKTVQEIATNAKVSRPSVYDILKKLKARGLVTSHIVSKRKTWLIESEKSLAETLYNTKKAILNFADGVEESNSSDMTDSVVVIHRGDAAIKKIIFTMIENRKDERFLAYTAFSDVLDKGWLAIFTPEEINTFNKIIKKNRVISELIAPEHWIEKHYELMGESWARDYEGRASSSVYLPERYFQHSGQIFAFKDAMYLLALKDKIIIEIRHSDIQKMILAMYAFIKEQGETVDVNRRLRELMSENKKAIPNN